MSIGKIQAPPLAQTIEQARNTLAGKIESGDRSEAAAKSKADAEKVGRDFEAIMLRQMLAKANVAGKSGYADMAVEGLASSISAAGGLGLGKIIAEQLQAHDHHAKVAESLAKESPTKK